MSTAAQNDTAPPWATGGSACVSTWTNRYPIAAAAAHTAYRARIRAAPSGRSAISVATRPPPSTNGHRGRPSTRAAASAMITISNVAHPTHCTRLSTVGRYDTRPPSRPRRSTMAGTPSRAPAAALRPSSTDPMTAPTTIAATVTTSGRPGRTT